MTPTDGPHWTGVFTTSLTAVVSLRATPGCPPSQTPTQYTALRLALPAKAGSIDINIGFDVAGCPLQVTPFSADSQDR